MKDSIVNKEEPGDQWDKALLIKWQSHEVKITYFGTNLARFYSWFLNLVFVYLDQVTQALWLGFSFAQ